MFVKKPTFLPTYETVLTGVIYVTVVTVLTVVTVGTEVIVVTKSVGTKIL